MVKSLEELLKERTQKTRTELKPKSLTPQELNAYFDVLKKRTEGYEDLLESKEAELEFEKSKPKENQNSKRIKELNKNITEIKTELALIGREGDMVFEKKQKLEKLEKKEGSSMEKIPGEDPIKTEGEIKKVEVKLEEEIKKEENPPIVELPVSVPEKEATEQEKACVNCGFLMPLKNNFCPKCGVKQPKAEDMVAEEKQIEPVLNKKEKEKIDKFFKKEPKKTAEAGKTSVIESGLVEPEKMEPVKTENQKDLELLKRNLENKKTSLEKELIDLEAKLPDLEKELAENNTKIIELSKSRKSFYEKGGRKDTIENELKKKEVIEDDTRKKALEDELKELFNKNKASLKESDKLQFRNDEINWEIKRKEEILKRIENIDISLKTLEKLAEGPVKETVETVKPEGLSEPSAETPVIVTTEEEKNPKTKIEETESPVEPEKVEETFEKQIDQELVEKIGNCTNADLYNIFYFYNINDILKIIMMVDEETEKRIINLIGGFSAQELENRLQEKLKFEPEELSRVKERFISEINDKLNPVEPVEEELDKEEPIAGTQVDSIQSARILERVRRQKREREFKRIAGEEDAKLGTGMRGIFKRIGSRIKRTFSLEEQNRIKALIDEDNLISKEEEKHILELFSEAANTPELENQREIFRKIVENRGVFQTFKGHPTTQWIMDRRLIGGLTLGVALTGMSSFALRNVLSRAAKMAVPVIGGGVMGAVIGGFRKYAETSEKVYNARQWADELDKKYDTETLQDPENRRKLAAEIAVYQDKIKDTKFIRGNEAEALKLSMVIRNKMLDLATIEEGYNSTDLNADYETFRRISEQKFEIDDENRAFSEDKKDIWDAIISNKKAEVKKAVTKGALVGGAVGVGVAGLAYTLTHFYDIQHLFSGGGAAENGNMTPPIENPEGMAPKTAVKHLKPFLVGNKDGLQQVEQYNEFHAVVDAGKGTIDTNERMLKAYINHYNQVARGANLPELKVSEEAIDKAANDLSHKYNPNNNWVKAGSRFTLSAGEMDEYLKNAQSSVTGTQHEYISSNLNFGVSSDHSAAELLNLKSSVEANDIISDEYFSREDYVDADRYMIAVNEAAAGQGEGAASASADQVSGPKPFTAPASGAVEQGPFISVNQENLAMSDGAMRQAADATQAGASSAEILHHTFLKDTLANHEMSGFGPISENDLSVAEVLAKRENAMESLLNRLNNREISYDDFQNQWERLRVPGKFGSEPLVSMASPEQLERVEKWQKAFQLPRDWSYENDAGVHDNISSSAIEVVKRKMLDPATRQAIATGKK